VFTFAGGKHRAKGLFERPYNTTGKPLLLQLKYSCILKEKQINATNSYSQTKGVHKNSSYIF
jgi:hypothetical protein